MNVVHDLAKKLQRPSCWAIVWLSIGLYCGLFFGVARSQSPLPPLEMTPLSPQRPPLEYQRVETPIPNYPPSKKWGEQAEPYREMQKPLSPRDSMQHAVVPKGFHLELFAAEPMIGGKPIAMTWDARGRLWLCETVDYPNRLDPANGRDRIRILEDTDGDGRADRSSVFAEGLSIPTTLTFHRGGVIVQNGTKTIYLRDTDGDGKADEKRVLFSGWNMQDTHGGVSHFQYGLDNWIWAMQGYNRSAPRVRGQPTLPFRQGFFRFRPDGSKLEFLRSTNNNTWGLGMTEEGIVFGSTANRNPSVYMPIPNRYYERVQGWTPSLQLGTIADSHLFRPITSRVRQVDHHGGYTAGAGHAIYTARTYPKVFWNRTAFVCGPTGHLVGIFALTRSGSDFRASMWGNLFASEDEWTAPIMAEVGPDGNVWIIDWYNYIVQHNPTPRGFRTGKGNAYETDLRDKQHGRIWRVVYDRAADADNTRLNLEQASAEELVATLRHPNLFWRQHAQRLLVERGRADVAPALLEILRRPHLDAIGLDVAAIHALWTLHGLGLLDGEHSEVEQTVVEALRHPSAGVRRNAVQVLPRTAQATQAILESGLLKDPDAQVRLMTFLALSDRPGVDGIGRAIWTSLQQPENLEDRWIRDAGTSAAAMHASAFLRAATASSASTSPKILDIVRIVAEHQARSREPASVASVIVKLPRARAEVATAILRGWDGGWPENGPVLPPAATENAVKELLTRLPRQERFALVRLAKRWKLSVADEIFHTLAEELSQRMADVKLDGEARWTAARRLLMLAPTDASVVEQILEQVTPQSDAASNVRFLELLRESRYAGTGKLLVERFRHWTPRERQAAIGVLLSRTAWTLDLLTGLEQRTIPDSDLSLERRQMLANHPDPVVRRRVRRWMTTRGALPGTDRAAIVERLLPQVNQPGDAAAGKQVYLKHCSKCHVHGTEGTRVGPDLTGMAVHPKSELLVHIIDPNSSVESNYRTYTILTVDGVIYTGLLASESKSAIELIDSEGRRRVVLRADIEELVLSSKSLMPEGWEQQLSVRELRDLLEFLTQRGQYLPVRLDKYATVASDRGMFYRRDADVERLIFDRWGEHEFKGIPFVVIDPKSGRRPNVILLHSPNGAITARMPKSVRLPCHGPLRAVHLLSGVSGWGYPASPKGSVSLIIRFHYEDGTHEDRPLKNGVHFADYIRRIDVPESEFAFALRRQQIRYLAVRPSKETPVATVELIKGSDRTAPVVMAMTFEFP